MVKVIRTIEGNREQRSSQTTQREKSRNHAEWNVCGGVEKEAQLKPK